MDPGGQALHSCNLKVDWKLKYEANGILLDNSSSSIKISLKISLLVFVAIRR